MVHFPSPIPKDFGPYLHSHKHILYCEIPKNLKVLNESPQIYIYICLFPRTIPEDFVPYLQIYIYKWDDIHIYEAFSVHYSKGPRVVLAFIYAY